MNKTVTNGSVALNVNVKIIVLCVGITAAAGAARACPAPQKPSRPRRAPSCCWDDPHTKPTLN